MTKDEYKAYYRKGYQTDVTKINITDNTMEFVQGGQSKKFTYKYVGKKILTYKKGNRGVRFLFEATDADAGQFKYVQFSDHNIAPVKAEHFHIFFGGTSQEALFEEMDNWPTYYPDNLSGQEIAQEMLAHWCKRKSRNLRDFFLETIIWLGYETGNRLCVDVHSAIKIV